MAAKKQKSNGNGGTAVAVKRSTGVEVAGDWAAELSKYAQDAPTTESASVSGNWLTARAGVLNYKGVPVKGNATEAVILASVLENVYYEEDFDADNPASPVCFAFSTTLKDLKPHESAPKPQHAKCAGCPQNEFGSADKGKGKKCKNMKRLAMIPFGDGTPEALEAEELAFAKLSVMSVKEFDRFEQQADAAAGQKLGVAPFWMASEIKVVPDPKSQFLWKFAPLVAATKAALPVLAARAKEARDAIVPAQPYQPIGDDAAATGKKPVVKKSSGKKKY